MYTFPSSLSSFPCVNTLYTLLLPALLRSKGKIDGMDGWRRSGGWVLLILPLTDASYER
jgi:hypothetical protein